MKRFIQWDANENPEGWVNESHLATFDELKLTEIMIKKGTMAYEWDSETEIGKLEEDTYGHIIDIKDG